MVIFVQHADTKELCHIKICKGEGSMEQEKEICKNCYFYDETNKCFCYELQTKVRDIFHCNRYQKKGQLNLNSEGLYIVKVREVELDEYELKLLMRYIKKRNGIENPSYRLIADSIQFIFYEALNRLENVNERDKNDRD